MTLSELHVGDRAEVLSVGSETVVRRRLMDLGLIRGTSFRVLRVAPLGDPMEIFCKGLYLTVRKKEAEGIAVTRLDDEHDLADQNADRRGRWRYGRRP